MFTKIIAIKIRAEIQAFLDEINGCPLTLQSAGKVIWGKEDTDFGGEDWTTLDKWNNSIRLSQADYKRLLKTLKYNNLIAQWKIADKSKNTDEVVRLVDLITAMFKDDGRLKDIWVFENLFIRLDHLKEGEEVRVEKRWKDGWYSGTLTYNTDEYCWENVKQTDKKNNSVAAIHEPGKYLITYDDGDKRDFNKSDMHNFEKSSAKYDIFNLKKEELKKKKKE